MKRKWFKFKTTQHLTSFGIFLIMFLPFLVIQRKKTSCHSTAVMFHLSNGLEMRMKLSSEIYTGFSIMNMEIMVWYGNYAGLAQREHYIHV